MSTMSRGFRFGLNSSLFVFVACLFVSNASAHDPFTDALEAHYGSKSVTCKTCHPDNKDRGIRNALGNLVHEALEGRGLHDMLHAIPAEGEPGHDEKKAEFEEKAKAELMDVWGAIAEKTISVDHLFNTGLMNGVRLTDEQLEALQEAFAAEHAEHHEEGEAGSDGGRTSAFQQPSDRSVANSDVPVSSNGPLFGMSLLAFAGMCGWTWLSRR